MMTWFEDFTKASPDERRAMLAKRRADEDEALQRRVAGKTEPEHQPSEEQTDEARAWLQRVQGVDLDEL